jgi:Site-specific recombinases, DNA invertase Pin homologs
LQIAIYSRKSKLSELGDSVENQINLCRQYIKLNYKSDENILIYEDDGFSGKDTERPMFKKLMNDIKQKKIKILVCYKIDRISRNVADFSNTIKFLEQYNVDFVSITEKFDTSTPMGRAMIHISSVFAQLERETIAQRI